MRGLLHTAFLYLIFLFMTNANSARIVEEQQYFPTTFAYKKSADEWRPTSYGVVKKSVLQQIEDTWSKAFFTTDLAVIRTALARPRSFLEEFVPDAGALHKQFFLKILPLTVRISEKYLATKRLASTYNEEEWKKFVEKDKGLRRNICDAFLCAKSLNTLGENISSLINNICVLENFKGVHKKSFPNDCVRQYREKLKSAGCEYIADNLETAICSMQDTADDLRKTGMTPALWKALMKHFLHELSAIPCIDAKGKTGHWGIEEYIAGLASQYTTTNDENFEYLVSTITGLKSATMHPAMQYYQQSREISIGMMKQAVTALGTIYDNPWQKLGGYIFTLMQESPEIFLSHILTHRQISEMFESLLATEDFTGQQERKFLMEQYVSQNDNAQEVVVPLIILQNLLQNTGIKEKLLPATLVQYVRGKGTDALDAFTLGMINFIRQTAEILTSTDQKATKAEEDMRKCIETYSRSHMNPKGDPLEQHKQQAVGVLLGTALVILQQNPDMRDCLFSRDEATQTRTLNSLFKSSANMSRALFSSTTREGDTVRYRYCLYIDEYKQQMLQMLLRLAPIRGELSFGRTQGQFDNIASAYKQLNTWTHFTEHSQIRSILRVLTFVDTETSQPRHRMSTTMPLNNPGGGQCWAYSLRTAGEPSVRQLITNLYKDAEYKKLHTDSSEKYIDSSSAFQILGEYTKHIRACTGVRIVYEEIITKGTTITDDFGRTDIICDTMLTPRIATSLNGGRHFWASPDQTDITDIAQNMRLWSKAIP